MKVGLRKRELPSIYFALVARINSGQFLENWF